MVAKKHIEQLLSILSQLQHGDQRPTCELANEILSILSQLQRACRKKGCARRRPAAFDSFPVAAETVAVPAQRARRHNFRFFPSCSPARKLRGGGRPGSRTSTFDSFPVAAQNLYAAAPTSLRIVPFDSFPVAAGDTLHATIALEYAPFDSFPVAATLRASSFLPQKAHTASTPPFDSFPVAATSRSLLGAAANKFCTFDSFPVAAMRRGGRRGGGSRRLSILSQLQQREYAAKLSGEGCYSFRFFPSCSRDSDSLPPYKPFHR